MASTGSSDEKFTFFFRSQSPFSQWHPVNFTSKGLFGHHNDGPHTFENCEQWMMFNKAVLFKDDQMSRQILATPDPKKCKGFGRKVKNFDDRIWKQHREKIVYEGNKHKFLQNGQLRQELVETAGTTLVEASPFDRVYGIGLSATNPKAQSRATWRGLNLLGQILTRLRDEILAGKHSIKDAGGASANKQKSKSIDGPPPNKISKKTPTGGAPKKTKAEPTDVGGKKRKVDQAPKTDPIKTNDPIKNT